MTDLTERSPLTRTLVGELLDVVRRLEELHPGRPFTPDGHLVGAIGEVAAEALFDIVLSPPSTAGHDALCGMRPVEIKATFGQRSVALRPTTHALDGVALVVLRLTTDPDDEHEVVYNGPYSLVRDIVGAFASNGQARVALSRLRKLDATVPTADRVPRRPS